MTQTRKENWIKSIAVNAVFLLGYILLFDFQYEVNDDIAMSIISYLGDYHLVFISTIIGRILIFLNGISNMVAWYPLIMVILTFVSFCTIVFCVFLYSDDKVGYCFSVLILTLFGFNYYCTLQFTETAGILAIGGGVLLITNIREGERWNKNIFPILLILIGSMYRRDMCLLVLATLGVYILWTTIMLLHNRNYKLIFQGVLCMGIVLGSVAFLSYFNNRDYMSEDWAYYTEFNMARAELLDRGMPEYQKNKKEINMLGMDEYDIEYFSGWNFADPEMFNLESAKELVSLKEEMGNAISVKNIGNFVREMSKGFVRYPWFWVYILSAIICATVKKGNWKFILLEVIGATSINAMFYFVMNRYLLSRVDIGIILCLTITNMMIIGRRESCKDRISYSSVVAITILMICCFMSNLANYYPVKLNDERQIYSKMTQDSEHLYLRTIDGTVFDETNSIWKKPNIEGDNIYLLGGWRTYSPTMLERLEKYNVENPFREVINSDNIYIEGENNIQNTIQYINRHYDQMAKATLVKNIEGVKVYKVTSGMTDILPTKENKDGLSIKHEIVQGENNVLLKGEVYLDGQDSFCGEVFAKIKTASSEYVEFLVQTENTKYGINDYRRYSSYSIDLNEELKNIKEITMFYKYNDDIYMILEEKIN